MLTTPDKRSIWIFFIFHENVCSEYALKALCWVLLMGTHNIYFPGDIRKCLQLQIKGISGKYVFDFSMKIYVVGTH